MMPLSPWITPLIADRATDVMGVGSRSAGITGALMVADLAYAFDPSVSLIKCVNHFMPDVAAAIPEHIMLECAMLGRVDGLIGNHNILDGGITLSDRPGMRTEFYEARLAQLMVSSLTEAERACSWGCWRSAGLIDVLPQTHEEVCQK